MGSIKKIYAILDSQQKKQVFILLFLMLIGVILETLGIGVIIPFINILINFDKNQKVKSFFDFYTPGISKETIIIIGLFSILLFFILKNLFSFFLIWKQNKFSNNFIVSKSTQLYKSYLQQPYSFFLKNNTSFLIRNVHGEVEGVRDTIMQFSILISESLVVIFIGLILILYNPIPSICIFIFITLISYFFSKVSKNYISNLGKVRSDNIGFSLKNLTHGLFGIKEIKLYNRTNFFLEQYKITYLIYSNTNKKYNTLIATPRLLLELLAVCGIIIIVFISFINKKSEESLIMTLALFAYASFKIMPSISKIYNAIQHIVFCQNSVNIVCNEINSSKISNISNIETKKDFLEKIDLKNVTFFYENCKNPSINNLTLSIRKLTKVAIIGESGSGKSTIVDLILGFHNPTNGGLYIDGELLNSTDIANWQTNFGYVPQRVNLIDDSIKKNIAYGIEECEIDESRLIESVKRANLTEFINTLPNGFETNVGERGTNLSGGQGQRIILARALYHNPKILILDEFTSALDDENEKSIIENVFSLKDITIIMITHKPSMVKNCDYIFQLEKGKVIKEGKPSNFDFN
jgi:ABC-type multidrug transport system fused ATPase/permease subunit